MNFSTKFTVRTDLADETVADLKEKQGRIGDGICFERQDFCGNSVDKVTINSSNGEKLSGKPMGDYYTIDIGDVCGLDKNSFEGFAKTLGSLLKKLLPDGLVLVVCLGNDKISADAIGPLTADSLVVTRHIKIKDKELFLSLGLGESACIVPGVMGDTGAESAELVSGVVSVLKPEAVVVVDALASSSLSRLARTVQITNTGICPGSGVGNNRCEISERTMGVPTIAIGVPTVVDTSTLCAQVLRKATDDERLLSTLEASLDSIEKSFVCPKETDKITATVSKLLGYGINFAIHKDITIEEMDEFLS